MACSIRILAALVAIIALLLPAACTELIPLRRLSTMEKVDCEQLFAEMEGRVVQYGVRDAGVSRINGFPAFRVDRFLASFAQEKLTESAYAAWLERLRQLDETARLLEWRNLPMEATSSLQAAFGRDIETALKTCGQRLVEQTINSPDRRWQLRAEIEMPDAYSTWQRVFGLYFFSRWTIGKNVWQAQQEMRKPFLKPSQDYAGQSVRYEPPRQNALEVAEVARILQQSAANPLAMPEPDHNQLKRLFASFAPVWRIDTANDNDRIGVPRIGIDVSHLDIGVPSVYYLPSYTRFHDQVLLQLNYLIWFPARPAESLLDIYAGRFDGLIWRVTLGMDGKPMAYDSIHACGCYYQIFPGTGFWVQQPQDGSEPILSPMPIGDVKPGERLVVQLASRSHFIHGISLEPSMPGSITYSWQDYDELRSLPTPDGQYRSLFDNDGLLEGSERSERFLLWPMGVASPGAMRQWGTHAIAFIGKRHFDEPRLIEEFIRPVRE